MAMSHQAPSKPYHVVMKLWFEPGGLSLVPSSDRAADSIPATEPMSEPPVLGEGGNVAGDSNGRVLAHRSLIGVHIEQTGAVRRLRRRLGRVRGRTGQD